MKVINLFAGPGAGKSTTAALVFGEMKRLNLNVELVTEYAKSKVWENSLDVLKDQVYLLAKQNHRLEVLRDKVDYVITDSPLLLCMYYSKYGKHPDLVKQMVPTLFETYDNVNFFIERTKPYNPNGRVGGEESAKRADEGIRQLLTENSYPFISLPDGDKIVSNILYISKVTKLGDQP